MLSRASAALAQAPADKSDALAALVLEYRNRSVRFVSARAGAVPAAPLDGRSAAAEIVLWFHSRIYFTATRALVGKALTAAGRADRGEDSRISARQTLVAVDRSRAALQQFPDQDMERRALLQLLDAIASGFEEEFPGTPRPKVGAGARGDVQEKSPPHF